MICPTRLPSSSRAFRPRVDVHVRHASTPDHGTFDGVIAAGRSNSADCRIRCAGKKLAGASRQHRATHRVQVAAEPDSSAVPATRRRLPSRVAAILCA